MLTAKKKLTKSLQYVSSSAEQTKEIGRKLGSVLKLGDVVLLLAGLGAGKTTLVQGLAEGRGCREQALSPTFIIAQTFHGKGNLPIHHLDFYRVNKKEILALGIEDYLMGGGEIEKGIVLIEWADRCPEVWPEDRLEVRLSILPGSKSRKIVIQGKGEGSRKILEKLKKLK